jgi:hypothetical protein
MKSEQREDEYTDDPNSDNNREDAACPDLLYLPIQVGLLPRFSVRDGLFLPSRDRRVPIPKQLELLLLKVTHFAKKTMEFRIVHGGITDDVLWRATQRADNRQS